MVCECEIIANPAFAGQAVNRQPSTVNRQPSTVNRQPSTVNRQPLTAPEYIYAAAVKIPIGGYS